MKKKVLAMLLAVMMVAALLTGCGAASESADMYYNVAPEAKEEAPAAEAEGIYGGVSDGASGAASQTDQKLIKRVNIDAETEDLQTLMDQLADKIAELGGYVESQELYNGSMNASYRSRRADMTIRIPAQRLSEFIAQVEGASNVVNYSETTDDVTLKYVDTESRIKALEVEQERLLELLSKAETMDDLLVIESRLTDVRYELESFSSQLRALENKVSYATVYLNITQVKVYTEVEPQTVWQRIGSGFSGNLVDIGEDLTDFFVWVITYSPQLIFWGLVITGGVILLNRKLKKTAVRKAPIQKPENEENA